MTISVETRIRASVEKVFVMFTDFLNMEDRIKGIKKIEFLEREGRSSWYP